MGQLPKFNTENEDLSSTKSNENSYGQFYEIGPTSYFIWSHFTNFYWSTLLLLVCGLSSQINHWESPNQYQYTYLISNQHTY